MAENSEAEFKASRVAIVGCGNLGKALLRGILLAPLPEVKEFLVFDKSQVSLAAVDDPRVRVCGSVAEIAQSGTLIILSVKPKDVPSVAEELRPYLKSGVEVLLVSVAAGVRLSRLRELFGDSVSLARVMPNTPALIGCGMSAIYAEDVKMVPEVRRIFAAVGRTTLVSDELHIDAATAISGSGPAFVFLCIEAIADGGVKLGLPKAQALELAAQTFFGAAAMVLDGRAHPAQLRDMVASPGGTTIYGLHELESLGVRGALMAAVEAAAERARELQD